MGAGDSDLEGGFFANPVTEAKSRATDGSHFPTSSKLISEVLVASLVHQCTG